MRAGNAVMLLYHGALTVLEVEPENQLVKDLLSALKQREIMGMYPFSAQTLWLSAHEDS